MEEDSQVDCEDSQGRRQIMDDDEKERLLYEVEKRPILYDMSDSDFKNVRKKMKTWDEIAAALKIVPVVVVYNNRNNASVT
jgi:hypothetical protein